MKLLEKEENHMVSLVMTLLFLAGAFFAGSKLAEYRMDQNGDVVVANMEDSYVVVVDSGHGGRDSGKVSDSGVLEKDVNLQIALLLKEELSKQGIQVIMTRESDVGLYEETDSNKKSSDMKARIELIESAECDIAVSIHQNSYSDPKVKGAQCFYYTDSKEGKRLAEIIQSRLVSEVDPTNHRLAKGNDSYYLLKKSSVPTVIVECGFLSNPQETALLTTSEYQQLLAENIAMSVVSYLTD